VKLNRGLVAVYVVAIFVSGGVTGYYAHRFYDVSSVSANATRNPEEFRRQYMEEMKSRLKLTEQQATQLSSILDETRKQFRETRASIEPQLQTTRDSIEPQLQKIRDEQQTRVHAILNPQQQTEYDKIRAERLARMKQQQKGTLPAGR
jgi:DNA anti-recombination protein RmuC